MIKIATRLTALFLCLSVLSGCAVHSGGTAVPTAEPSTPSPAPTESVPVPAESTPAPTKSVNGFPSYDGIHAEVSFRDMAWEDYDMVPYLAGCDRLAAAETEAEAEELYAWLLGEYRRINTMDELAWIHFYAEGSEYYENACQTTDNKLTEAGDKLYAAVSDVLSGKLDGSFSAFLGEDVSDALRNYQEMTDEETLLRDRESALKIEYNNVQSADMEESERGLKCAEIFVELLDIRRSIAQLNGFESYADFAYSQIYGRDYTPEDAAALCREIHSYAQDYFDECYFCSAYSVDMGDAVRKTPEELIALLGEYAPRISPAAAEAQAYMERNGLFFIGSAEEIASLSFTTELSMYQAPFLYCAMSGGFFDIQTIFHEFGHYTDGYLNRPENLLTDAGSYDIFEIHSTGLEAISTRWFGKIFGEYQREAQIMELDGMMYNVVFGCLFDEFQQYVYDHPGLSAQEVTDAYCAVCRSYGIQDWWGMDPYEWTYVNHNFESPFYYISYAASALASLQIWTRSRSDPEGALALYTDLVSRGAFAQGYCQLLEDVGLCVFTDGVDDCIGEAYESLRKMCADYEAYENAA